jgi:WD40 repeat protein
MSGRALHTLRGHSGFVLAVAVTPDGRRAVSGSTDKTLKVWDLESGTELVSFIDEATLCTCAVCPEGAIIIAGGATGRVHFLQLEGVTPGLTVVTAWGASHGRTRQTTGRPLPHLAFGCLHCRTWSEIPESAVGAELPCPHCGEVVKLNRFVIEADWRPVAAAWRTRSTAAR